MARSQTWVTRGALLVAGQLHQGLNTSLAWKPTNQEQKKPPVQQTGTGACVWLYYTDLVALHHELQDLILLQNSYPKVVMKCSTTNTLQVRITPQQYVSADGYHTLCVVTPGLVPHIAEQQHGRGVTNSSFYGWKSMGRGFNVFYTLLVVVCFLGGPEWWALILMEKVLHFCKRGFRRPLCRRTSSLRGVLLLTEKELQSSAHAAQRIFFECLNLNSW